MSVSRLKLVFVLFCTTVSAQAAPVPSHTEVLIIGAGLSGLATAYQLKKAGIPYHVLELAPKVGGRVRTVRYQRSNEARPIYADSGMEEYWESNPAVALLHELKLPMRGDVALSSIVLNKKLETLDGNESASDFFNVIFTPVERAALEAFKKTAAPWVHATQELRSQTDRPLTAEQTKLKDISLAKWVLDQHLPPKVAEWIRVSLECEMGTGWDRISALDGLAEFHIFMGEGEKSYRVFGGNDRFTEGLARVIGVNHLSVNKRVTQVSRTPEGPVTVSFLDTEKNINGTIRATHVVSTVPLFRLAEIQFIPPLSNKKREAVTSQSWGSYFKAHLFLSPKAERFWIGKKGSVLPILSDSDLGVIYDGNPDQKGGTRMLSLLITGDIAERFNMMPLEQVRAQILASFEKLWPGFSPEVKDVELYRFHPRAIAAWPVGRSRFDDLSQEIRRPEDHVYLAGDFTESSHSDGSFLSAERVVKQIKQVRKSERKGKK